MSSQGQSRTSIVRAGIASDAEHGAVVPPLHLSSTFAFEGFGKPRRFDYTRSGNPTRAHTAEAIADLEGGAVGIVTSTGMSAVTLVLQLVKPGDLIVAAHDCYGGTQRLLRALSAKGLFEVAFVDLTGDGAAVIDTLRAPRLVWIETPSNPLLRITDIAAVVDRAHARGATVVVDNTFLSPALQQPIALGADVVVHSTTKYLNGHSDVVGGAVVARDAALGQDLAWWANALGITGAPFDSFLTLRGMRTLFARIDHHLDATAHVIDALAAHPAVSRVYYPGLSSHPGHDIAQRQQKGFGAMASFELRGGTAAVEKFVGALRCFTLAESLGGVESLVAHPATMTHASMTAEARAIAGISDSLVRLSVGIENGEDLAADIVRALDAAEEKRPLRPVYRPRTSELERRPLDIVLLGAGKIGRELLRQIAAQPERGFAVRAVIDRSGYLLDEKGLAPARLRQVAELKERGHPLAELAGGHAASPSRSLEIVAATDLTRPLLIDATAADTIDHIQSVVDRGWDVVLANKIPLTENRARLAPLMSLADERGVRILHEATVGAGLPVIDTINALHDAGDRVLTIEGCPSGTLGYLFGELTRGRRFSSALAAAIAAGYTEPDPRVDLSGVDVARKALILGRAIGFDGDLSDIEVESLVPGNLAAVSVEDFVARAASLDET